MSVTSFYRVQCSGTCGRWLAPLGSVRSAVLAQVFTDWASADKAAAEAGWHDGADGRYAKCTCAGGPPHTWAAHPPLHEWGCRINNPRLVPICPDCRAAADSTEGTTL